MEAAGGTSNVRLRVTHWLTFNQIKQLNGQILKGAKGNKIFFFKLKEKDSEWKEEVGDDVVKSNPVFRAYTVFNLKQTSLGGQSDDSIEHAPEKLRMLLSILDIKISEYGNQPHFQPGIDVIVMPERKYFKTSNDYDVTLLHELIHWTGHEARLNRATIRHYNQSDETRAEEELVAEVGSVFLATYFGIKGDLFNHASYISFWKKNLDAKSIARAISQAAKAFEWLVSVIEEQNIKAA